MTTIVVVILVFLLSFHFCLSYKSALVFFPRPLILFKYIMFQKITETIIIIIGRATKIISLTNIKGNVFSPDPSSFLWSMKQSSEINLVPMFATGIVLLSIDSIELGQFILKETQIDIIWI
jgi:hypothetical protein